MNKKSIIVLSILIIFTGLIFFVTNVSKNKEKNNIANISIDDKLKNIYESKETFEVKNKNNDVLFLNDMYKLHYEETDKEMNKLLNNLNNIIEKIFNSETSDLLFDDVSTDDPIIEGLGVTIKAKVEHINKNSIVFRIEESGQLGATSMYWNYYYTFDKKTFELVKIEQDIKYVDEVANKLKEQLKEVDVEIKDTKYDSKEVLKNNMYNEGYWYIKDDKYVFVIDVYNYLPPFNIEVKIDNK